MISVDVANGRVMDVAADHAVDAALARLGGQRLLEIADEIDGVLHLELGPFREGPIGHSEFSARGVVPGVGPDREIIGPVAEMGEPAGVVNDDVELVAVNHEQFFAVGRLVDDMVDNLDAAELHAEKFAGEFVVIAGNEDHAGAFADLAQQFLHDVVVGLWPVPAGFQPPAVDDVADEEKLLGLLCLRKSSNNSAWQPRVPR